MLVGLFCGACHGGHFTHLATLSLTPFTLWFHSYTTGLERRCIVLVSTNGRIRFHVVFSSIGNHHVHVNVVVTCRTALPIFGTLLLVSKESEPTRKNNCIVKVVYLCVCGLRIAFITCYCNLLSTFAQENVSSFADIVCLGVYSFRLFHVELFDSSSRLVFHLSLLEGRHSAAACTASFLVPSLFRFASRLYGVSPVMSL